MSRRVGSNPTSSAIYRDSSVGQNVGLQHRRHGFESLTGAIYAVSSTDRILVKPVKFYFLTFYNYMKGSENKMPKILDLTNQRFAKLVALKKAPSRQGKTYWLCQCDCGNTKEVQATRLVNGITRSCGCLCKTVEHTLTSISPEEFSLLVKNSNSYTDLAKKCGFSSISQSGYNSLKEHIQELQLDISHFVNFYDRKHHLPQHYETLLKNELKEKLGHVSKN